MAVHAVFISSKAASGVRLDRALRERFDEVYRVGHEFWLVDSARDADQVASAVRDHVLVCEADKLFVAVLTRDVVPELSEAARRWLVAPGRTWRKAPSREEPRSLFAIAA